MSKGSEPRRIGTKTVLDKGAGWDTIRVALIGLVEIVVHRAAEVGHTITSADVETSVTFDEPDDRSAGKATVTAVWKPIRQRWWKR